MDPAAWFCAFCGKDCTRGAAHGRPHLDRVNATGRLVEKEWLLGMSFSDALCYAISDFRSNYETYIFQFKNRS